MRAIASLESGPARAQVLREMGGLVLCQVVGEPCLRWIDAGRLEIERPVVPVHSVQELRAELEKRRITVKEAARRMGICRKGLNLALLGHTRFTPRMASRLEHLGLVWEGAAQ